MDLLRKMGGGSKIPAPVAAPVQNDDFEREDPPVEVYEKPAAVKVKQDDEFWESQAVKAETDLGEMSTIFREKKTVKTRSEFVDKFTR